MYFRVCRMDHLSSKQTGDVMPTQPTFRLSPHPQWDKVTFLEQASPQAEQYNQIMSFSRPLAFVTFFSGLWSCLRRLMNCAWTPHFFFEWDGKAESNRQSLIPLIESPPYFFFFNSKVTYIHLELPGQQSKVQNLNHRFTISMTFSHWLLAFSAASSSFPFGSISNCDVVLLQEALGLKDIKPDLGWGLLTHAMLWCSCPALSKWRERGCKKVGHPWVSRPYCAWL